MMTVLSAPTSRVTAQAAHTLKLAVDLDFVMSSLGSAGIEALAFNGPTLAALAYSALDREASGDLDVIVRPRDQHAALEVLIGVGFRSKHEGQLDVLQPGDNEVSLVFAGRAELDLHWALSPVYFVDFDLEGAFARSQTVHLMRRTFRTLGNEDFFLGLAIHHTRHCRNRSSHVVDVVRLINSIPIDWDALYALASVTGAQRIRDLAVLLAASSCPHTIPVTIMSRIEGDAKVRRIGMQMYCWRAGAIIDVVGTLRGAWLQSQLVDSMRGRMRYLSRRAAIANSRDVVRRPDAPLPRIPNWIRRPLKQLRRVLINGS
jgi:hypothetical protein